MKKSVTIKTILSAAILLMALIPFLFISSCQKEEPIQIEESLALKSGVLTDSELVTYWEETFNREEGKPYIITKKIGSEDLSHFKNCFILQIKNGNEDGSNRISSAIVKVDNEVIFDTYEFSQEVGCLEKEIFVLKPESELTVELRSEVGSLLNVFIKGNLLPGKAKIDENGGELVSGDELLKVSIPPNSVETETIITAASITDIDIPELDDEYEFTPNLYSLEPSGIVFSNPVTIRLKYNISEFEDINNVFIFHWSPILETEELIVPKIDENNNEFVIEINHFSYLVVVEKTKKIKFEEFTDSRDGKIYKSVQIGNQTWMAENLAYLPSVSPPSQSSPSVPYFYVNGYEGTDLAIAKATDNYKTYGALYNWTAATQACPSGWHLPTDSEWEQLAQYISDQMGPYSKSGVYWLEVGKHLKATSGWSSEFNGTNDFGFSALPGGHRNYYNNFVQNGNLSIWWSSSNYYNILAWYRNLSNSDSNFRQARTYLEEGLSVRCVKD